jgi:hypothetical protein
MRGAMAVCACTGVDDAGRAQALDGLYRYRSLFIPVRLPCARHGISLTARAQSQSQSQSQSPQSPPHLPVQSLRLAQLVAQAPSGRQASLAGQSPSAPLSTPHTAPLPLVYGPSPPRTPASPMGSGRFDALRTSARFVSGVA